MQKLEQDFSDIVGAFKIAPLGVKCQAKLDHKTVIYLHEHDHPIEDTFIRKNGKTHKLPGIAGQIKRSPKLVKFFLNTSLSFWDTLIKPEEYEAYINSNIISH